MGSKGKRSKAKFKERSHRKLRRAEKRRDAFSDVMIGAAARRGYGAGIAK